MCKVSLNHESAPVLMRQPFTVHPLLGASAPTGGCNLAGDGPVLDVIYGLSVLCVLNKKLLTGSVSVGKI